MKFPWYHSQEARLLHLWKKKDIPKSNFKICMKKWIHCNSFVPLLKWFSFKDRREPQNFGAKILAIFKSHYLKTLSKRLRTSPPPVGNTDSSSGSFRNLVKLQRMAQVPVVVLDRGNNTTCTINLHGSTIVSWRVNNQVRQFLKVFLSYVAISRL